ncbi:hypothetical protein ACEPAF_8635 [Sanghuangporus sanghuang]
MLEQYSLPSPLSQLDMYHRLEVGPNPMQHLDNIQQNPSQLIPSFIHDAPSVINSDQTKETLENISCTLDAGVEQEAHNDRNCPDEALVTREVVQDDGMFDDNETVASTEAKVSDKVNAPTISEGGVKGQSRAHKDQGGLSGRASKSASNRARQELLLIDELRNKAKRMKKGLLRRFKRGKKTTLNKPRAKSVRKQVQKEIVKGTENRHRCTYPNCSFTTLRKAYLNRHISTHYPDAYFCPVCHATFGREDGLNRHLSHSVVPSKENKVSQNGDRKVQNNDADIVPCIESDEALRYEVGRDPERFNFYYLGVMEDYEMDDEHFEALAKRKRKNE